MVIGGIKYRNQSFNRLAAGVSSVLLIVSIVGIFTPTFFYQMHASRTPSHFVHVSNSVVVQIRSLSGGLLDVHTQP